MAETPITRDDILLFLDCFRGRSDAIACQTTTGYYPINAGLDETTVEQHLSKCVTYAAYVLEKDSSCSFICIDLDIPLAKVPTLDVSAFDQKIAYLKAQLDHMHDGLTGDLGLKPDQILIEDTGGRGFHLWVVFQDPYPAKATLAIKKALAIRSGADFEFFPKQGSLTPKLKLGNPIKLPLSLHRKYQGNSCFIVRDESGYHRVTGYADNIARLRHLRRLTRPEIENLVIRAKEISGDAEELSDLIPDKFEALQRPVFIGNLEFLFSNCSVLAALDGKARSGIPFSRNEAFHYANLLLSVQGREDYLKERIRDSYGVRYRGVVTDKQINRIKPMHPTSCASLVAAGLCERFCVAQIEARTGDDLLSAPSPVSTFLKRIPGELKVETGNIRERISDPSNVVYSYWQLRRYHSSEDMLYLDFFDFDDFGHMLETNSQLIGRRLQKSFDWEIEPLPRVMIPKKLDTDGKMTYRTMTYLGATDAVAVQSVFNIVGPILDATLSRDSYGYRLNNDPAKHDWIFRDWRECYPIFRDTILGHLRNPTNTYYMCCDLKKYYDTIRHDILLQQIRGITSDPGVLSFVTKLLASYHSEMGSGLGVPQGPPYARILANLYLDEFDRETAEGTAGYARYVDDIYIFYRSREAAQTGLRDLMSKLSRLGLSLSDDEEKKAEVRPTSDDAPLLKRVDQLQYGIFDEYKYISTFKPTQVTDFYGAIQRGKVDPYKDEMITPLNDHVPTICYLIQKEEYAALASSIRRAFAHSVKYMVETGLFYPKRQKYIFRVLIPLLQVEGVDQVKFYEHLDAALKTYYLLSLRELARENASYGDLLTQIIQMAIKLPSQRAFAIRMSAEMGNHASLADETFIVETMQSDYPLAKRHLMCVVNYLSMSAQAKDAVRTAIPPSSSPGLKRALLSGLANAAPMLADEIYIKQLVEVSSVLVLPHLCSFFTELATTSGLFTAISQHIFGKLDYKDLTIGFVRDMLVDGHAASSEAELTNLKELYGRLTDDEAKRQLTATVDLLLGRPQGQTGFSESHSIVKRQNGCIVWQCIGEDREYDFLEEIPHHRLKEYGYGDLEEFAALMSKASSKGVTVDTNVQVDAERSMVRITYSCRETQLSPDVPRSELTYRGILDALKLTVQLYKKADSFRRNNDRAPRLLFEDLWVDWPRNEAFLGFISTTLCAHYPVGGALVDTRGAGCIPQQLAALLKVLFFPDSEQEAENFMRRPTHGASLHLRMVIARLATKKLGEHMSCSRLQQVVDELEQRGDAPEPRMTEAFFSSRLRSVVFKKTFESLGWYQISSATKAFLAEVQRDMVASAHGRIMYGNRVIWLRKAHGLHVVSRMLVNLAANVDAVVTNETAREPSSGLLKLMLYHSALCTEMGSLIRCMERADLASALCTSQVHTTPLAIRYGTRELSLTPSETKAVNEVLLLLSRSSCVSEVAGKFSLREIGAALYLALASGRAQSQSGDTSPGALVPRRRHDEVAFCFLVAIPLIEKAVLSCTDSSNMALATPARFGGPHNLPNLLDSILGTCGILKRACKFLSAKRSRGMIVEKYRLPFEVVCKSRLRRSVFATHHQVQTVPVCGQFVYTTLPCSWETVGGRMLAATIPDTKIWNLVRTLSSGRFLGFNFNYVYVGKSRLFFDLGAAVLLLAIMAAGTLAADTATGRSAALVKVALDVAKLPLGAVFSLLFLRDLSDWIPTLGDFLRTLLGHRRKA